MLSMWIDVYNYATNTSFSIHVGGYTYIPGNTFINSPFAMVYGASHKVRLTYDNGFKIYIGETNSTWHYPQISIRDVVLGFGPSYSNWYNNWSVSFVTSFPTIINSEITRYAITTDNISSQSVNYANSAGSVAWSNITGKPATATRWPSWSEITSKPTTISGHGITDAYTKAQTDTKLSGYLPLTGGVLNGHLQIGANDNTSYKYLILVRSGRFIRINNTDVNAYFAFGTRSDTGSLVAEKILEFGDSGLRYSPNNSTYYDILHTGNYNSYAPKLDGTGASGTWGINITGNAASASTIAVGQGTADAYRSVYFADNSSVNSVVVDSKLKYNTSSGDLKVNKINNGVPITDLTIGSQSVAYATSAGSATNSNTVNGISLTRNGEITSSQ